MLLFDDFDSMLISSLSLRYYNVMKIEVLQDLENYFMIKIKTDLN